MEKAILQTLCYHDLFSYPLTLEEIHRFLIGRRATLKEVRLALKKMIGRKVENLGKFYFLKNRREIVAFRKKRKKYARKKQRIARRLTKFLKLLPTVKMVALTGTVAVDNAEEDDDIDLLIVTNAQRLWITRIGAVLLIELLASRPLLEKNRLRDAICLNILLDENHLRMPSQKQNLYVAHEIAQMEILWQKDDVYQKFLEENQWVEKFLPNWRG